MSNEIEDTMKGRSEFTGMTGELKLERRPRSLRDKIADQLCHARFESRKADDLSELALLLDKNPEVARILDLLDKVR